LRAETVSARHLYPPSTSHEVRHITTQRLRRWRADRVHCSRVPRSTTGCLPRLRA